MVVTHLTEGELPFEMLATLLPHRGPASPAARVPASVEPGRSTLCNFVELLLGLFDDPGSSDWASSLTWGFCACCSTY